MLFRNKTNDYVVRTFAGRCNAGGPRCSWYQNTKKQSSDLGSSEMIEFLMHKLNRLQSDSCLNIVVSNYLFNILSFLSPIIVRGRARFYPIDGSVDNAVQLIFIARNKSY